MTRNYDFQSIFIDMELESGMSGEETYGENSSVESDLSNALPFKSGKSDYSVKPSSTSKSE